MVGGGSGGSGARGRRVVSWLVVEVVVVVQALEKWAATEWKQDFVVVASTTSSAGPAPSAYVPLGSGLQRGRRRTISDDQSLLTL
jgi:hypothetical protein